MLFVHTEETWITLNKQINGHEKAKLGSYAVLSRISILADLRVFCANFGSEKMGLCYFLHFFHVCQVEVFNWLKCLLVHKRSQNKNLNILTLQSTHAEAQTQQKQKSFK